MDCGSQHRPGRYLAIQIAGKYYAVANDCVREIMPAQELFPPLLKHGSAAGEKGLNGFLHTRGLRLPVFDLPFRLGGGARLGAIVVSTQTRIVVAEAHGTQVAFYADRLTDMILARAHEIRRDSIVGHGRPKTILVLDRLWDPYELKELA